MIFVYILSLKHVSYGDCFTCDWKENDYMRLLYSMETLMTLDNLQKLGSTYKVEEPPT